MRVGNATSCRLRAARRFVSFAALLCALMLVLPGCGDDADVVKIIPIPPMPENVFKLWADAYERRDIDRYAGCLAEDYVHTFGSSEAGWGIPQEDSLGREADLECARKLFENENIGDIAMDLHITGGPWPTEAGFLYRLEPFLSVEVGEVAGAGTTGGSWAELKLSLARDELPCEPCVYIAFSTWFDVEIVANPVDTTSWVISKIHESNKVR